MSIAPRTLALTATAMVAFAANSVLCRMALGTSRVDPAGFSAIRATSGALTLLLLVSLRSGYTLGVDVRSALALACYMAPFSFAYVDLNTGTGALILFACVQLTMLVAAVRSGERPPGAQWLGMLLALGGLVYLLWPGVEAPSLRGALFMTTAGVAWGIYSLRGRGSKAPLLNTVNNFLWCAPLMALVCVLQFDELQVSASGAALAIASGALASGCGYAIWYAALGGLSAMSAAVVQLSVPVLAAAYGVLFMAEPLTQRLAWSTLVILGGVALALVGKSRDS